MASLLNSDSRRLYSWWWDSHNTPKNSKWLHENLRDMDDKVKTMIKLIEEDADSFARKAEMYYEKRPELMKLVEEFYRAYRALAERYDHSTGELRHAHRTLAKAFPDQVPSELIEDSPESPAQEREHAMCFVDDLLQNLQGTLSMPGVCDAKKSSIPFENSEGGLKELLGSDVEWLKKALADLQAEKEGILQQYQQSLQKVRMMEEELNNAQEDLVAFNEKASLAEIEALTLKEALVQLETEKNADSIKINYYLDKISDLEAIISQLQEGMMGLDNRAVVAECQAQNLKDEMSRLQLEKGEALHMHEQCLLKISSLENIVSAQVDETRVLKKQAERAEAEVSELRKALNDLNMEKEASALRYKCCMETISKLEKDLAIANEDVKRLTNEVLIGNTKLKTVEGKCTRLELSNEMLRLEAENLVKKIAVKDQELSKKHGELEKLQSCLQDERMNHENVEATLQTLQNLHHQSQGEQKALALELENTLQILKDMKVGKTGLEEELQKVIKENICLNQANLSSSISVETMENEILTLREIKEKLEKKVSVHMGICNSLQKEVLSLKGEIYHLNETHQALIQQLEVAGLNPESVATSVKRLQNENSMLREACEEGENEKSLLLKNVKKMEEVLKEKELVESTLTELNAELQSSHEKVKSLQESFQIVHGEKTALASEKASLLSQLEAVTENMHGLLEKNAILENSLSTAKVELEGLREKSKGLEEICELLKSERLYLLTERDTLVSKLEHVEKKLENMEQRYMGLEEKYACLQKEKEAMHCHVDKLETALGIEKQERTSSQDRSETRLAGLESQIHHLQEENRWKKKESEEELEKSLKAQFELSVLHKFIKDMEEKNYSLIVECQKHVEASKLSERLISELESENLEQQVESELLLDEIERLRLGIYQIFRSLETTSGYTLGKVENERAFTHHILESIEDMKCSISKHEDEQQQLVVENSILLVLLEQLQCKGMDIVSQKVHLEHEFNLLAQKFAVVKNEKDELQDLNEQLKSELSNSCRGAAILEVELASHYAKQADLHQDYNELHEAYAQVSQENTSLLKKFSELEAEKHLLNQQNEAAMLEFVASANQCEVLRSFGAERVADLKVLLEDLRRQHEINNSFEKKEKALIEKLELQAAEGLALKDVVRRQDTEIQEMSNCNAQMNRELEIDKGKSLLMEVKLMDAETKLEVAEELNLTLTRTVTDLKNDLHASHKIRENLETDLLHLSGDNRIQKEEIQSLKTLNKKLEVEHRQLHQEIEENTMRELTLNTELEEMNNEFEVYETEASSFCFDLQVSSIQEVLLKNKVQELTRACRTLENERSSKSLELEQIKQKVQSMEKEITELRTHLSAYSPVIANLRDDIVHLENNVLPPNVHKAVTVPEFLEATDSSNRDSSRVLPEDHSLIDLKDLQMRVKEIRKMTEETSKPLMQTSSNCSSIETLTIGEATQLKPSYNSGRDKLARSRKKGNSNELYDSPKLQRNKSRTFDARGALLMKDIPLDHVSDTLQLEIPKRGNLESGELMVDLWEVGEGGNRNQTEGKLVETPHKGVLPFYCFENVKEIESELITYLDMEKELGMDYKLDLPAIKPEENREVSDRKILERLSSDANKLRILQSSLDIMREKWDSSKKNRKAKNVDSEMVDDQLSDAEDTLIQLIDLNAQLVNHIELCPQDDLASPRMKETVKTWRMKVMEQADKGAERIGRLQLEVQKIQFNLLKAMDDKKAKGRTRFFRNRNIILRDFVYNGRKNSGRRKKAPDCCFRQTTSGKLSSL